MNTSNIDDYRMWKVRQAKAHLSEILRLAEEEGPQYIGENRRCVVVSAEQWHAKHHTHHTNQPMGQWLVENMPSGLSLDFEIDRRSDREIPFQEDKVE